MQNVVWPTTMVQNESGKPPKLKNALSAMPVMIPGKANGSTKSRLMASRPKKVMRWMAKAAHEPRTKASAVAANPACTERPKAVRISASFQDAVNHFSVRPGMVQLSMLDVMNAYEKMT